MKVTSFCILTMFLLGCAGGNTGHEKQLAPNHMKTIIQSKEAPAPIGPYSQAVLHNGVLYVSGQIALDPVSGALDTSNITDETNRVMLNLQAVLEAAGMDFSNVLKCSIFLSDMNYFGEVNAVYGRYFEAAPPARETVAVRTLPKHVNVEISCIAAL